ncbi:MAG: tryptophan synthase subunit alpha [Methanomicrobiales archaeon]|jgi:tryptophan synthase alpha chain|nr:tryptophan synthase subunit alpha [Methanomicrobiales archaeon]
MSRITTAFRSHPRSALITFLVGGYPTPALSLVMARTLIAAGTAVLEIGMPHSDPVADGPVNERAAREALACGMTPDGIFSMVRTIRGESSVPLVLMTYYNLIHRRGVRRFVADAASSGADGLIVVDLPIEEADEVRAVTREYGLELVFLVSPVTEGARLDAILAASRGFVYLISTTGVTGAREELPPEALTLLETVRPRSTLPLAVGFGISLPSHVMACVAAGADGVIVGSAITDIVSQHHTNPQEMVRRVREFVMEMVAAAVRD